MIKNSILTLTSLIWLQSIMMIAMEADKHLQMMLGKRLLETAKNGSPIQIQALLNAGADIHFVEYPPSSPARRSTTYPGQTALHIAILCNNIPGALQLIQEDPDINLPDPYGNTPLHLASENTKVCKITDVLIKHGACLEMRNTNNETPLARAFKHNNSEAITSLIEANACTDIYVSIERPMNTPGWAWHNRLETIALFEALSRKSQEVKRAVVTSVPQKSIMHILPCTILFTHRKIICNNKDVGKIIMQYILQDIVNQKMLIAQQYIPYDYQEDTLRTSIIASIHSSIKKSPPIQKSPPQEE